MQDEKRLFSLYRSETGSEPMCAERMGGGYYADVYRMTENTGVCSTVVKVYKTKGIMERETASLAVLRDHALFPMPDVLWTHYADGGYPFDVMAMQYLAGENGGSVHYFGKRKRESLAGQVVDNLIAWHNTENPMGFGEIGAEHFTSSWQEFYYDKAQAILQTAGEMQKKGQLPGFVLQTMQTAVTRFDKIFYLPITRSSLIHGDYNMWNILVDKKACKVTAVIDPCNCMWADSEMDLYQLNNANGKHLGLLSAYAGKRPLSENFDAKCAFYELFTEIEHYYRSAHPIEKKRVAAQANALKKYL